jgi:transcriptional regulator with XRE-family HTH domain
MDLRQIFATNLRRLRHARGISQEILSYDSDVDRSYISRLERGIPHASLDVIGKFVDVLQCEPAEFFRLPEKRRRMKSGR